MSAPLRVSVRDDALSAQVVARRPLRYATPEAPGEDRGPHVRAGSALAWLGARLCVVQDDASFVALLDGPSGAVRHVALEAAQRARRFDEARGNKHLKLDLEACVTVHVDGAPRMLAFGSGSSAARERVLVLRDDQAPRLIEATALYAMLRARADFSGSELNVEGAVDLGDSIMLLQRGNGATRDGRDAIDATATLDAFALVAYLDDPRRSPPALGDVTRWDLGRIEGERLTFTDGVRTSSGPLFYVAAAEASPDATRDGPVAGVALGTLGARPRWTPILDERGAILRDKVEGLAIDPSSPARLLAIVDKDDAEVPSELLSIELGGDWA